MNKLSGKTAIVVGASSGMGRAIAVGFAQEGADIIGLARRVDALEDMASEVRSYGRQAHVRHFDVFDRDAYPDLMRWLDESQLDFDIVVHMVGGGIFALATTDERLQRLFKDHGGKPPFWTITDDDVDRVLTLGVKSAMSTCRYLAPRLMAKGRGSLIVIGSGAGKAGEPQRYADYAAEKGAVMCYVPAIAHELKPYGVAANCLLPGMTYTPRNPSPAAAKPEDCVPAAVFLAQQDANGVTGQWFDARAYQVSQVS
ncbi:MAG: toluenesulfonate zinc-independent alcohol dehydrogenase [Chloroflexi bacterium]|nr:toluenesulfonate zinc-independent alcohol dehydrogenase [Chloroflexota bacterium]